MALALGGGIAPAQEPEKVLLELKLRLVLLVARRHLGLRFQLFQLSAELEADVGDARQVLARIGEAVLGLAAALLVARDARGLLEEHAQLLGLRLDDARDHALLDDRVGARPESGAEEHVGDVAPAHGRAVDVVVDSPSRCSVRLTEISAYWDHCPAARPCALSKISSTEARASGLRCPSR